MVHLSRQLSILVIVLFGVVPSKELCDTEEVKTTTEKANKAYLELIDKHDLDPLYNKQTEGKSSAIYFNLTDSYLYGLKNCSVINLSFNVKEKTYIYIILCPRLVLNTHYNYTGAFGDAVLDGDGGKEQVSTGPFIFILTGNYNNKTNETDHKRYFCIKNYKISAWPLGNILIDYYIRETGNKTEDGIATHEFNTDHQEEGKHFFTPVIIKQILKAIDILTKYFYLQTT